MTPEELTRQAEQRYPYKFFYLNATITIEAETFNYAYEILSKSVNNVNDWKYSMKEKGGEELIAALKNIEALCDNTNPTHEEIWHIAYGALNSQPQSRTEPGPGDGLRYVRKDGKRWTTSEDRSYN